MKKQRNIFINILLMLLLIIINSGEVRADEENVTVNNPVYNKNTDSTTWDYVYFGSYPQSKLKSSQISDEILEAEYNDNGDAIVDGIKYRRLKVDDEYQYFIYEPIKWKVLQNEKGNFLLMSDMLLDYAESELLELGALYSASELRSRLNGYGAGENKEHISYEGKDKSFIDIAFSNEEKEVLINPIEEYDDLITIPTVDILTDNKYGFSEYSDFYGYSRSTNGTAYANTVGEIKDSNGYSYIENMYVAVGSSDGVYTVNDSGYISSGRLYYSSAAVVIMINGDSTLWSKDEPDLQFGTSDVANTDYDLERTTYTYTGKALKPEVEVYDGDDVLYEGIDYKLAYKNCTNAGTATVTITGLNDYTGSKDVTYTINKAAQKISVSSSIKKAFTKKGFSLGAKRTKGNGALKYTVSASSVATVSSAGKLVPKKTGKVVVTITAAETKNYKKASAKTTVTITKAYIKKAAVKLSKTSYGYDGKVKKPAVSYVTLDSVKLTKNKDYTIKYSNNKNIGKATVTITGKGNYNGTVKKTFTISLKKGSVYTVGDYKYKAVSTSEVYCAGFKKSQKSSVSIPATVKIGGKSFKVTGVGKNAFKNKTTIRTVTLGSNVKEIEANAFYGCKKMLKLTVKGSWLNMKIGKNAFYDINEEAKVYYKK